MGRRGYPPEFRRKILDLVGAGRSVADVARNLDISEQSIYVWRKQDRPRGQGLLLRRALQTGSRDGYGSLVEGNSQTFRLAGGPSRIPWSGSWRTLRQFRPNGTEQRIRGSAALDPRRATCTTAPDMCALLN